MPPSRRELLSLKQKLRYKSAWLFAAQKHEYNGKSVNTCKIKVRFVSYKLLQQHSTECRNHWHQALVACLVAKATVFIVCVAHSI